MLGLPFLNAILQVEAVGFRVFQSNWLGVLITPWCMNYLILPGATGAWPHVPESARQSWSFPAGTLNFVVADEPGLGTYQQCPLFASMDPFDSREMARQAALAALDALFEVDVPAPVEAVSTSKRNFLFGRFIRGD